jgi:hypothetical protein
MCGHLCELYIMETFLFIQLRKFWNLFQILLISHFHYDEINIKDVYTDFIIQL